MIRTPLACVLVLLAGGAQAQVAPAPVPIPRTTPDQPNSTPPERVLPPTQDNATGSETVPRGVVRPPAMPNSGLVIPPPEPAPGTTRVIPPPGTPGGDPTVQPR